MRFGRRRRRPLRPGRVQGGGYLPTTPATTHPSDRPTNIPDQPTASTRHRHPLHFDPCPERCVVRLCHLWLPDHTSAFRGQSRRSCTDLRNVTHENLVTTVNITPQLGSQHEGSLRPSDSSSTLEMGIRATITHAGIVSYRERASGADDDVKNRRESKKTSLSDDRLQTNQTSADFLSMMDCLQSLSPCLPCAVGRRSHQWVRTPPNNCGFGW